MTNFLRDLTPIPGPASDLSAIPGGADPLQYMDADKYNTLRAAALDLRSWVLTGLTPGTFTNATLIVDADGRITGASSGSAGVPTSRTITVAAPLSINGGTSHDLSINVSIAASSFSTSVAGVVNASGASTNILRGDNAWSTPTQLTAALDAFTSSLKGLVPGSGGGTSNFLRADGTWTSPSGGFPLFPFGDGSDGTVTFDGSTAVTGWTRAGSVYTADRSTQFAACTVNNGVTLKCGGFRHFVRGTMTNNGLVTVSGNDAVFGAGGTQPYANGLELPSGNTGGTGGGLGTNSGFCPRDFVAGQVTGGSGTPTAGTAGGRGQGGGGGGASGSGGGNGGAVTLMAASKGDIHAPDNAISSYNTSKQQQFTVGSSGAAGGGSGAGCGGASGGMMVWCCGTFAGTGTFESKGGAGFSGFSPPAGQNAAGGGGGGSGGIVVTVKGSGSDPTVVVTGGAGGAGGTGTGGGVSGAAGGAGGAGLWIAL